MKHSQATSVVCGSLHTYCGVCTIALMWRVVCVCGETSQYTCHVRRREVGSKASTVTS
jgi:hypothetical protein